eukprot:7904752-Heterocapsa_arctica.AAC.1
MLSVSDSLRTVLRTVLNSLQEVGGEIKFGPPPRSPLERQVRRLLNPGGGSAASGAGLAAQV